MKERRSRLIDELRDKEYREAYADQHVNALLAAQISAIREQRGLTQAGLAERIKKQQPAISRIENVNYARWNIQTLREVANALGCWLDIRFQSWGQLVDDADSYSMETLRRDRLEDDPVFFGSQAQGQVPEPVRWMQKQLFPWLLSNHDNDQLSRWLRGLDLPSFGDAEPPFVWIGRAVEVEPEDSPYRSLLIDRALGLFSEIEHGVPRPGEQNPLPVGIFNLLAMFPSVKGWQKLNEIYQDGPLSGMMLPAPVQSAFLSALIRNQVDRKLESTWLTIIREGKHDWLPANEFDAFEGLKWLSPRPRIDAIAKGLREMYMSQYGRSKLGAVKLAATFGSLMEDVKHTFKNHPSLDEMLWKAGQRIDWDETIVAAWVKVFAASEEDRTRLLEGADESDSRLLTSVFGAFPLASPADVQTVASEPELAPV